MSWFGKQKAAPVSKPGSFYMEKLLTAGDVARLAFNGDPRLDPNKLWMTDDATVEIVPNRGVRVSAVVYSTFPKEGPS